jgi:hypothetical protein
MVGEQIQVSQYIGNFEAKKTADYRYIEPIFRSWSVPEEYGNFKMYIPSASSVVLYFTVVRILAHDCDHESDVSQGFIKALS